MQKKIMFAAAVLLGGTAAWSLNWDNALIMGTTPGGKMFYAPGEEMVFTLKLEGMKEPLPADTYFVDWERRGDDGLKERGRAPLPFPPEGLVLKTKSDKPGFVCIEANVVTKDGKRVPKNHRWEKRVFFQGGAGVQPELIPMADEPADYDAFWAACLKELAAVPMDAQMTPVECSDKEVRLYAVRIPCAGPWPVTGYLTIPVKASKTNRMPITASYRGASQDEQLAPKSGPHDRISMLINPNGYELGRGPEYVKQFFKDVSEPGYGYGMGPKSNEKKETSYWKWCALRAIRYLQWIKTLPEWDGKELVLGGGSQGDWQCYHAAAHVPGVTRINANGSWGCDWTGQNQFKRLRSTYRPGCWYPDMAYFDPVFAAKRITCPVNISFSGLGDYCSTPASLTLVYRNLKGPKKITYVQGSTHGWRPAGTQKFTVDGGFDAATQPPPAEKVSAFDPLDAVRAALVRGERKIVIPKRLYLVKPKDNGFYLRLKGVSDTVIDFSGSELRGLANTGFFHLEDCTNVTIRNVELDYCDLPFTQARIVSAYKDGTQTLEIIDGYPRPSGEDVGGWPFQVYDKDTLELKNPMRMGAGFKLERLADGRYRVSGGGNRTGAVGDIAVWSMPSPKGTMEGDHVSVRDVLHSRATVRCVFENITAYATPGGRAFEEHLTEANVYRNCRIVRRPPETDFAKRGLKRLRSGNHDAFMSRRAVVGPKILGCTALYHCDDAVNISGMYGVVYEVKGNEVRLLEYTPTVFRAGDTAQAMSADGRTLPRMAVKAVGAREAMTAEERAYMTTIGLWRGLDKLCRTAIRVTVDDASALHRGDAVISDRAQGNGFEIRGCHFGRNRAFCVRMRASNGTIADNVFDRPEGCGIYLGPEYEWLEGGLSENVTITNNIFVGCKPHIGGTAAHRKRIPREAFRNVKVVGRGVLDAPSPARLDPIAYIRDELAAGSKSITIPNARYWLTPAPGETCYLALTNLTGVTIDCAGSEFVGTVKTTMFALHACTNVTLRNVSVDYADLPFTQAVIEKVDKDGGWDVRVIPGYPCPAAHALSADDIWPVQAYDAKTLELKNPMRFRDNIAIARTGMDTYRITGGQNRKGDVGDIAVWSIRETMRPSRRGAVTAGSCAGCTFENVTVYSSPHGCGYAESSADGNRYLGCALVRRPPETDLFPRALKRLRSGNHDAFNSRCSYVGPTLDRCTFQYHCDDCVNISGFYAFVTEQKGRTLRIAPYGGNLRIDPGDTCQLMTFEGACLPDAKIVSLQAAGATTAAERKMFESYNLWPGIAAGVQRAFTAELDADRVLPPGSVIISNRRMGNGFRIRNCTMGHNRARGLLIKASDGVIESNIIERVEGWAVQIAPEYEWMEGGCSRDMVVKGNVFCDNGGGVLLAGNNGARKPLPADSHRNVAITGNAISGSVNGITVVGCTGLDVRGNAINLPAHPKARAIDLVNVADVQRTAACRMAGDVSFVARTIPETAGLAATVTVRREGDVWHVTTAARNAAATNVTFKLVLAAEPGFPATRYLIPGVNYNGNDFVQAIAGDQHNPDRAAAWKAPDIPTGWEKGGEPWVFAYDRSGIPSCTISENADTVFALFASVEDAASHVSSCSMERRADGSFRHVISWPVTEAPVSYTDKRKFSPRYDTYLTLKPGETFTAKVYACTGRPPWPDYGFAAVFPVAWKLLKPDVPAQLPMSEVLRLDKAFMDWGRRRTKTGFWYNPYLDDVISGLGNCYTNHARGLTIADLEKNPELNWWVGDALAKSKRLKPGEYLPHPGAEIGFASQSFQLARLSVEYGLRNHAPKDEAFGLNVFRSWIRERQQPSGHFARPRRDLRRVDASSVGWGLGELARLSILLKAHVRDSREFETAAHRLAQAILKTQRADGNLGSAWNIDSGEVLEWGGDSGGYVLMGLARYWQLTRDEAVRRAIDRAFAYYYARDIDHFECKGGAMDCASIDREGIHPFFTAAVALYEGTQNARYLTYAQKAGWYFLSWLYCHNGVYGPETDFAKYNWKPAGSTVIGTEHAALDDYGCVLIADLVALSHLDGNPLWRDVASLIWRNGTQGFPTETRKTWLSLERPPGAKNEAYFQTRWSKYRTGERKRGHLNSHCTAWGGAYRTSAIYDLSPQDLLWLAN